MADDARLQFDVAAALAVLIPGREFSFPLLHEIQIIGDVKRILDDLVEPGSFEESSCTLRTDISSKRNVHIDMGDARLFLCPGGTIRAGGSGVAVQLLDESLNRHYALKVPRISVLAYDATKSDARLDNDRLQKRFADEVALFKNEREISRQLSHQNVVRYFYGDTKVIKDVLPGNQLEVPFSVSEWIDGALPLDRYLCKAKPPIESIISLISGTLSGLEHMHTQRVVHWDIKSDNILISKSGVAKLIDFGNAKLVDVPRDTDLIATSTKGKYPQLRVFHEDDAKFGESNRFRIHLPNRSWNNRFIDLWMLGQEWNRCLHFSQDFLAGESRLSEREKAELRDSALIPDAPKSRDALDCLALIFDRLLFPFDKRYVERFIGPKDCFESERLYYQSATDVLTELARIAPPFGAAQDIPELLVSLDENVRLPVTGNSVFTDRVAVLVDSDLVRPTALHYQLAQVRQVFPGATHTRFEHLLGTLTTASQFIRSLYLNDMNAFWRVSIDSEDIRAVLLASVLHDTGHVAFGHFIEEMDDLFYGLKHDDYIVCLLQRCLRHVQNLPVEKPSDLAPAFTITESEVSDLTEILQKHWCDPRSTEHHTSQVARLLERVISIFDPVQDALEGSYYLWRRGTRQAIDTILKSVIDGPIDADKIDYLRRDAYHVGVSYANGIDLERFFESLRVCVSVGEKGAERKGSLPAIGVSEKGVAPTETVITARYHMYTTVYWHRTVRSITAMLQRILTEVRLSLPDETWTPFMSKLLLKFRRSDDRQALVWLRRELKRLGLLQNRLDGKPTTGSGDTHTTLADLIKAQLGNRRKYFRMGFELQYDGRTDPVKGRTPREQLHDRICADVHPTLPDVPPSQRERGAERKRLAEFRKALETEFAGRIRQLTGDAEFALDTILLDVPEPGKDQIRGLRVDVRSKRSKRSEIRVTRREPSVNESPEDFVDLASISPIAATLANVFMRWARKVRIYMTRSDLAKLREIGIELGDVGAIWEDLFYERYDLGAYQLSLL